jgi:hypothetical protein
MGVRMGLGRLIKVKEEERKNEERKKEKERKKERKKKEGKKERQKISNRTNENLNEKHLFGLFWFLSIFSIKKNHLY